MRNQDQAMNRDPDAEVDLGEEVQVRRRPGSGIVAVRVPTELLGRIQRYARGRGLTVSEVLRDGAARLVEEGETTYAITIQVAGAPGIKDQAVSGAGWTREINEVRRSPQRAK